MTFVLKDQEQEQVDDLLHKLAALPNAATAPQTQEDEREWLERQLRWTLSSVTGVQAAELLLEKSSDGQSLDVIERPFVIQNKKCHLKTSSSRKRRVVSLSFENARLRCLRRPPLRSNVSQLPGAN
jgi:hypothetical protein